MLSRSFSSLITLKSLFPGNSLSHLGCFLHLPAAPGSIRDVGLVRREAPCGVMCLRLIEYFDQKPCLIYIEMIPLLVEKIRINRFPWDSLWKSFEAVQSREWKMSQKLHLKRPGNGSFERSRRCFPTLIRRRTNALCSSFFLFLNCCSLLKTKVTA